MVYSCGFRGTLRRFGALKPRPTAAPCPTEGIGDKLGLFDPNQLGFQIRQILLHGIPYDVEVDVEVSVRHARWIFGAFRVFSSTVFPNAARQCPRVLRPSDLGVALRSYRGCFFEHLVAKSGRQVAGRQYMDGDTKSFLKRDLNRAHVKARG